MEAHADIDVLAQCPEGRREVLVIARLGDRQMKREIRVLAMLMRARGGAHEIERPFDLVERRAIVAIGGKRRRLRFQRRNRNS